MLKEIRNSLFELIRKDLSRDKVFCIGKNKTGTTTIMKVFSDLGYVVGNQREAELLNKNYYEKDFQSIINYCKKYQAFQDVPFSWPDTYKYLDKFFPRSKFILTVRDSAEIWYESLISFQTKVHGNGKLPTVEVLKSFDYVYKGWAWDNRKSVFGFTEDDDPYDKKKFIDQYNQYNNEVRTYFLDKSDQFIEINVSNDKDYLRLCNFLGKHPKGDNFPWENKTF